MSVAPVRRRRRAFVVAALGVCLALTGCSEDAPEPAPLESPAASEEPSESPEPSAAAADGPPEMPEAAKGTSKKSAEAFVRYAVEVLNYTSRTLDTKPLTSVASADCAGCSSVTDYVDGIREADGSIDGGEWRIRRVFVVGRAPTGSADLLVQVVVDADAQQVRETRTSSRVRHPSGVLSIDFTVTPERISGWQIRGIEQGGA
jgi:hypothetical protein